MTQIRPPRLRLRIEDEVLCGPSMVFTNVYNSRSAIERKTECRTTLRRRGASLGANCMVVPGITVGRDAFVGAGDTLTRDCPDWALLIGSPAPQVGWASAYGDMIPLPLLGVGEWVCPVMEDRYVLAGDRLTRIPGPEDILAYVPGRDLQRAAARA